jgi:hypothetical protein
MSTALSSRDERTRSRAAPALRVSKLRLVFGPAATLEELLRALADALDPLDLEPTFVDCTYASDGYRLRVTCEFDPRRPDLGQVLGRLLRRRWSPAGGDAAGAAA